MVAEPLPLWDPSDLLSQDEVWMARKGHVWDYAMARQRLGKWCGFSHEANKCDRSRVFEGVPESDGREGPELHTEEEMS